MSLWLMVKCSVEICLQTHENDEENRRRTADFSGDVMLQYTLLVFSFFPSTNFFISQLPALTALTDPF